MMGRRVMADACGLATCLLLLASVAAAEWIPPGIGFNYGGSAYSSNPLSQAAVAKIIRDRKIPMVKASSPAYLLNKLLAFLCPLVSFLLNCQMPAFSIFLFRCDLAKDLQLTALFSGLTPNTLGIVFEHLPMWCNAWP